MAMIELKRTFRVGSVDLPDPDEAMSVDQVLAHYARIYPNLAGGKVEDGGVSGDKYVWILKPNTYKSNG